MRDADAKNRPIRAAVQRWAYVRGRGYSHTWAADAGHWRLTAGALDIYVTEDGKAHVEGHPGMITSARGMTIALNRTEAKR